MDLTSYSSPSGPVPPPLVPVPPSLPPPRVLLSSGKSLGVCGSSPIPCHRLPRCSSLPKGWERHHQPPPSSIPPLSRAGSNTWGPGCNGLSSSKVLALTVHKEHPSVLLSLSTAGGKASSPRAKRHLPRTWPKKPFQPAGDQNLSSACDKAIISQTPTCALVQQGWRSFPFLSWFRNHVFSHLTSNARPPFQGNK